jgi:pilus assembly protein CpaB
MKIKTVALLVVAVGCGLVAMLGFRQAMNGREGAPQEEKVSVLVATVEIPVGTQLTPENVSFREFAKTVVPEDAILTEEQYSDRSASIPIMPNDMITLSKLTEPGVRGRSVQIPAGMRVVSVRVNDTQTHSNMLAPGDRVDVLVTYSSRNHRGMTTKTKTLLEYVEIFATGNKTAVDGTKDEGTQVKNVSLLVTPEQANYVYLAERKGELSLVWRNIADDEQVQVAAIDDRLMEELSGTVDKDAQFGFGRDPEDIESRSGIGAWLTEQEAQQAQPKVEAKPEPAVVAHVEPAEPSRPTWKMVIYAGENAETVELELPEEVLPIAELETASPQGGDITEETEPVSAPADEPSPFGSILEKFQNLPFGN